MTEEKSDKEEVINLSSLTPVAEGGETIVHLEDLKQHIASCASPSCWCHDDDGFEEGVTY